MITDETLDIVFKNTNFGRDNRTVVNENLIEVSKHQVIGHTASVCLIELGLCYYSSFGKLELTEKGNQYLKSIEV